MEVLSEDGETTLHCTKEAVRIRIVETHEQWPTGIKQMLLFSNLTEEGLKWYTNHTLKMINVTDSEDKVTYHNNIGPKYG